MNPNETPTPIDFNHPEFWVGKCPECGWLGMSCDAAGGEPIADTGDYGDVICPRCFGDRATDGCRNVPLNHASPMDHIAALERRNAELVEALSDLVALVESDESYTARGGPSELRYAKRALAMEQLLKKNLKQTDPELG